MKKNVNTCTCSNKVLHSVNLLEFKERFECGYWKQDQDWE